jgi:hypothetical protein
MSAHRGITVTKFINDAIEEKLRRETSQVKLEAFSKEKDINMVSDEGERS